MLRAGGPDRPAAIVELDPSSGRGDGALHGGEVPVDAGWLSRPEPIAFASGGDHRARLLLSADQSGLHRAARASGRR